MPLQSGRTNIANCIHFVFVPLRAVLEVQAAISDASRKIVQWVRLGHHGAQKAYKFIRCLTIFAEILSRNAFWSCCVFVFLSVLNLC